MAANYGMYENIMPLVAPVDNGATTIAATPFIDLKTAQECSIFLFFGVVTSATATDELNINLEASTAATTTSGANIAFKYRLSGAVTANTWGAITDATSAGLSVASTAFDGLMYQIIVDPRVIAETDDRRYVRVVCTEANAYTVLLWSAFAVVDPRYKLTTMQSVTA